MNRLDYASEIIDLAKSLGVRGVTPVENILNYCQRKIDGWVESVGGVANIEELEALVARNLQMVFEEINTDDDWERLKDHYARGMREFVFGGIRTRFEDDKNLTYGALVQRAHASATDLNRFVAIIDCRGGKHSIRKACEKAGIEPWAPNRIRHSYATSARKAYGLEIASVLLGHSEIGITQVYAEQDFDAAIDAARKLG